MSRRSEPGTYRVWCLTWGDAEDDGMDVVGNPTGSGKPERGLIEIAFRNLSDPVEAAELYAEWSHDNRDGYECRWPLLFRVRCPDGTTKDVEVARDFDPTFSGASVDP